ncbi:hypothetical protein PR048_004136 [Dryococelus australis]|uniref:Uncharacterized protein n=1 Tax=Dryococelus australis TaxID=614101 RepID=A0ABQ9I6K3_9NEOP|nr:hypothetical protein PR048_004136 [Dryococelus australis]
MPGGNGRSPRKLDDQWHRPARFTRVEIRAYCHLSFLSRRNDFNPGTDDEPRMDDRMPLLGIHRYIWSVTAYQHLEPPLKSSGQCSSRELETVTAQRTFTEFCDLIRSNFTIQSRRNIFRQLNVRQQATQVSQDYLHAADIVSCPALSKNLSAEYAWGQLGRQLQPSMELQDLVSQLHEIWGSLPPDSNQTFVRHNAGPYRHMHPRFGYLILPLPLYPGSVCSAVCCLLQRTAQASTRMHEILAQNGAKDRVSCLRCLPGSESIQFSTNSAKTPALLVLLSGNPAARLYHLNSPSDALAAAVKAGMWGLLGGLPSWWSLLGGLSSWWSLLGGLSSWWSLLGGLPSWRSLPGRVEQGSQLRSPCRSGEASWQHLCACFDGKGTGAVSGFRWAQPPSLERLHGRVLTPETPSNQPTAFFLHYVRRGHGGVVVRLLASHQGEPDSIPGGVAPGFPHIGIVPDDAVGRWVFSGISRFPRPCIPVLLYSSPRFTLIGSQYLDVKSCPNISTHSHLYTTLKTAAGVHGGSAVSPLTAHQGDPGSIPSWDLCPTMPLNSGFSWGTPVSPAVSFRRCSILTSITLIGSQDLDVKSHPSLYTSQNH